MNGKPTLMKSIAIVSFLALSSLLSAAEVPYDAPAVEAVDHEGKKVVLADAYKEGYTLVYFYPKADTPGCTKQGCSLRDSWADLEKLGVKVYGVSGDTAEAQKAFKEKFDFPFPLLADTDGKVMDAFGVPHNGAIAKRQAFLIKGGKVVWMDDTASTAEQAADVIAAIAALEKAP
jgi:thioredoxin-dependent peroxiredoxin